jgi:Zn finger protein HypA/HybF involved in hydrogenase expression
MGNIEIEKFLVNHERDLLISALESKERGDYPTQVFYQREADKIRESRIKISKMQDFLCLRHAGTSYHERCVSDGARGNKRINIMKFACEICDTEIITTSDYDGGRCPKCGQEYEYNEGVMMYLTEKQIEILRQSRMNNMKKYKIK